MSLKRVRVQRPRECTIKSFHDAQARDVIATPITQCHSRPFGSRLHESRDRRLLLNERSTMTYHGNVKIINVNADVLFLLSALTQELFFLNVTAYLIL